MRRGVVERATQGEPWGGGSGELDWRRSRRGRAELIVEDSEDGGARDGGGKSDGGEEHAGSNIPVQLTVGILPSNRAFLPRDRVSSRSHDVRRPARHPPPSPADPSLHDDNDTDNDNEAPETMDTELRRRKPPPAADSGSVTPSAEQARLDRKQVHQLREELQHKVEDLKKQEVFFL